MIWRARKTSQKVLCPKPSVIVQRYKFNSQISATDELIVTCIVALHQLTKYCHYKDNIREMLRDRLVCGINHAGIQKRLLAEKDLTFAKALNIAQALEADEKGPKISLYQMLLKIEVKDITTLLRCNRCNRCNRWSKLTPPLTSKLCHKSRGNNSPTICQFKDSDCHNNYCKRNGHITRMCRLRNKQQTKYKKTS